jgi:vacuolar-type H+-ATPase subunit I/STV1
MNNVRVKQYTSKNKCKLSQISRLTTYASENPHLQKILDHLVKVADNKDQEKIQQIEKNIKDIVVEKKTLNSLLKKKKQRQNDKVDAKNFKITFKCEESYVKSRINA